MNNKPEIETNKDQSEFSRVISEKAEQKLKEQNKRIHNIWFGLGMMGLIGWSIVIPTLLGTALGIWMDKRYPAQHSWAPLMLAVGLIIGCLNAWNLVNKETKEIQDDQEKRKNDK